MRQAGDDAGFDRIADDYYDRNVLCCRLCSERRRDVKRHDDINLEPNEFGREIRKSIQFPFRRAKLKRNVLPFRVTKLIQAFPKICLKRLLVGGSDLEDANSRYF